MISKLLYVSCDECGVPAGTADTMAETAPGARLMARGWGFVRRKINDRWRDLCPECSTRLKTG
jgi:hypothetical protein